MAKFTDLDPDHKSTFVVNLTAISVAAQLLHAACTKKSTMPSIDLTMDEWVRFIYNKAFEDLESGNRTVQDICELADNAIAQDPKDGEGVIVHKIY